MKLDRQKIAVTGGAGFIGSHLVDRLVSRGCAVTVFDNFATGSRENLRHHGDRVTVIEADVRDPAALAQAFTGCRLVFHLATHCVRLSLSEPRTNHEVNATGTLNALIAAGEAKVERFVYCSSSEVYGNALGSDDVTLDELSPKRPTTVYGASKLVGEHYTQAFSNTFGLKTLIVRPFNAYGPRAHFEGAYGEVIPRFITLLKNGKRPVVFGNGEQTRDFTYVKDIAEAMVSAAETDRLVGDDVNLAKGEEVSILAIARHLCELTHTDLSPAFTGERPGDIRRLAADISKARRLGLSVPKTAIRDGLREYLSWLEETKTDFRQLAQSFQEKNW
jgi:UDP-glucose 4-epimerase